MRASKILTAIALSALFLPAKSARSLQRIPFPDSSALQPMPRDVRPNISGNINYTDNQGFPQEISRGREAEGVPPQQGLGDGKKSNRVTFPKILGIFSAGLLIAAALMRRREK